MPIEQIIKHAEVDIAVASIELAGAELALASMIGRERALEKALLPIQGDYDVILVDTPPSLGLITVNALTASDGVIVPVQCEYLSLRGLVQLEQTLSAIRENLNPRVKIIGILPTMFDARSLHVREAVEILEENFGDLVFKTRIRKTIRYAEAPVKGQSVLLYEPKGQAAEAYRASPRRCSGVSKRRASMREGPLADLFRQTEGSQENVAETPAESAAAAAPAAARRPGRRDSGARARRGRAGSAARPSARDGRSSPKRPRRPGEQPRLRAVPDPTDAPEMPALPEALRARGEASTYLASIRVVGVGGGGLNALARMIDADIQGVEFVAINTDAQQLAMSDATVKLQIGRELTRGLGSGSDTDLGRRAAEASSTACARCCADPTSCS